MKKSLHCSIAILAFLVSHQAFATDWVAGVPGEYVQAYGYSSSLYAYSYTIKPMELHVTSCEASLAQECALYSGYTSQPLTISLLFSSKFGANESYPQGQGASIDFNQIAQEHPNEAMLPIPSIPLTLIGDGLIQADGSFSINYSSQYGLLGLPYSSQWHADEHGNIKNWDASWGRFTQGTSTNLLDSISFSTPWMTMEGSSTDISSWVASPVTRFTLPFAVFVPSEVSPVPEPDKYSMFLAGLGLVGLIARRRRDWQHQYSQ